jgi:hypothetical protein
LGLPEKRAVFKGNRVENIVQSKHPFNCAGLATIHTRPVNFANNFFLMACDVMG